MMLVGCLGDGIFAIRWQTYHRPTSPVYEKRGFLFFCIGLDF